MKTLSMVGPLAALMVLWACGQETNRRIVLRHVDPADGFSALEARLTGAQEVGIEFQITAEGAIQVDLHGFLMVAGNRSTRISAWGTFAQEPVDLVLVATEDTLEYGRGQSPARAPRPEHLNDAIFIGLTRMGILHNLARLVAEAPPDRADGGVTEWVVVDALGTYEAPGGDGVVYSFSIIVDGIPSGFASLEIGSAGLPLVREQTVRFPTGEMRVLEEYRWVVFTEQLNL